MAREIVISGVDNSNTTGTHNNLWITFVPDYQVINYANVVVIEKSIFWFTEIKSTLQAIDQSFQISCLPLPALDRSIITKLWPNGMITIFVRYHIQIHKGIYSELQLALRTWLANFKNYRKHIHFVSKRQNKIHIKLQIISDTL